MPTAATARGSALYIVLNARSGSGDADEARRQMEDILRAGGVPHEFLLIEDPACVGEIAARAAQAAVSNNGTVVVAGGDGTINAVAQAVLPTGRPFGLVPRGTFNYLSRAHGIPLDVEDATRVLLNAHVKPVQVGAVNGRIFLVNSTLGLYPQLMQDREHYKQQYGRRRSVALWSGLVTVMRHHSQLLLEVERPGQSEIVRTPSIFIGNNPLQLERVGLPEAEDVRQHRLAAVIVRPVGTPKLLWLALRGALGQLGEDRNIRNFAFDSMTVRPLGRAARGIKVSIDGEVVHLQPPLTFRLDPRPLPLIVPRDA